MTLMIWMMTEVQNMKKVYSQFVILEKAFSKDTK
uniref:Uncharacterized protein n=1 Tax=Anguilla anguilla TaxID=7936 RepID=A0A0E9TXL6_ANGAN